mgnify:CR=1 FL=1
MPFPAVVSEQPAETSDGGPVAVPSQDMVLGIYYLTQERPGSKGEGGYYKSLNEAILAYENGYLTLQTRIHVRREKTLPTGEILEGTVESTLVDSCSTRSCHRIWDL